MLSFRLIALTFRLSVSQHIFRLSSEFQIVKDLFLPKTLLAFKQQVLSFYHLLSCAIVQLFLPMSSYFLNCCNLLYLCIEQSACHPDSRHYLYPVTMHSTAFILFVNC